MGSYLDKPETTKKSQNDENVFVQIGSSSMQGWRINQEDAHNSLPNFGDKIAFFAVYDGHGGSEVAEYCSMKLPDFLKDLESFKKGDFEKALKDTFIGFDSILLQEPVLSTLREMARKNPDFDDSDMEDDETAEEIAGLHQEATMSLSEVLEKYKGGGGGGGNAAKAKETADKLQTVQRMIEMHSKTKISQKESAPGPSASSSSRKSPGSKDTAPENEVSSSSGKPSEDSEADSTLTIPVVDSASAAAPSHSSQQPDQSKSSESSTKPTIISKKALDDDSAITSSSVQENGEVSNNCSSTAPSQSTTATAASISSPSKASVVVVEGSSSSSSAAAAASAVIAPSSRPRIPNHISSSVVLANDDTESDTTTDDDHDETYKESQGKNLPLNSDDDTTGEDDLESDEDDELDEEEVSNEEMSGEEDEEEVLDDEFMFNMEKGPGKASGCTAVVALLAGRELFVANAGDSRCVVCRGGKVVEMSFDHKPEDDIEFQRIRKAGGRVTLDGRVNGGLNLSRAIGDHGYKMNKELAPQEQMISAMPDIKRIVIEPEDEFMVLACDGIWNYMTNEEVVGFVKNRIEQGKLTLAEICEELFHNCLAPNTRGDGTGCDNMTAIIVKFMPALKELSPPPASEVSDSNVVTESETAKACKRLMPADEAEEAEAEALVEPSEKRQKIEEDLTHAAVDTSTI